MRQYRLGVSPTSFLNRSMNRFALSPITSVTALTLVACGRPPKRVQRKGDARMQAGGPPHLSQSIFHGVELRIRIARFQKPLPQRCHTTIVPRARSTGCARPVLKVGTGTNGVVPPGLNETPITYSCSAVSITQ